MSYFMKDQTANALIKQLRLPPAACAHHFECLHAENTAQLQVVTLRADHCIGADRCRCFPARNGIQDVFESHTIGEENELQHYVGADDLPRSRIREAGAVAAEGRLW